MGSERKTVKDCQGNISIELAVCWNRIILLLEFRCAAIIKKTFYVTRSMQGIPVNLALDRGTFFTMKLPLPEETPS
jgi:hypothetical protein